MTSSLPSVTATLAPDLAARTLEAMRLGVVPDGDLSPYTVGRTDALATASADLGVAQQHGQARVFLGDYGTGKTHLLHLLAEQALRDNFLVCSAILDADEVSPSHPQRVYRALVRSLRYPDRPHDAALGLRHLLDRATDSDAILSSFLTAQNTSAPLTPQTLDLGYHLYLSPALTYWHATRRVSSGDAPLRPKHTPDTDTPTFLSRAQELLLSWLEGHPTLSNRAIEEFLSPLPGKHPKLYGMCDYRPWSRIYGYLLSGLSSLAQACGYSGLAILLDEAEFYSLLSNENKHFARVLFSAWIHAAIGDDPSTAQSTQDAQSPQDFDIGGAGIQKSLPPRYTPTSSSACGLYVVLAMTPAQDGMHVLEPLVGKPRIADLSPLSRDDYTSLASKVIDFYASANPHWPIPAALIKPLGTLMHGLIDTGHLGNARQAMKFIIEFLDVIRHKPDAAPLMIRGLYNLLA
jgi:hypothetical protein